MPGAGPADGPVKPNHDSERFGNNANPFSLREKEVAERPDEGLQQF
jgi:hypothetical protein